MQNVTEGYRCGRPWPATIAGGVALAVGALPDEID